MKLKEFLEIIGLHLLFFAFIPEAFSQAPPALPEGSTGLAASYPSDANIESHPDVLFADDFESYSAINQLTGSGNYDNYYQGSNLSLDKSTYFGGSQALRMRMPATGNGVYNSIVRDLSSGQDMLFMRVYGRYQTNYGGINSAHNALTISGNYNGPGQRPNGTDFFLVNIENSKWGSEPEPGYTHAYVYHPEQDDAYGEHWYSDGRVTNGSQSFGSNFVARPNVAPVRGEWICYEVLVQLNTPGVRDGRVAVWQDGVLIADWQNIRFRDVSSVKIDQIQLQNGGQQSSQQNDKWYDNLVIATSYVGPVSLGKIPNAPANLRIEP